MKKLPKYKISIDDEYAENGENLGISKIAFVKNPAIKIKGIAFSSDEPVKLQFTDDLKYRIAGPIMIPGDIYRNDNEEYEVTFTTEVIEELHAKMMANLSSNLFNLEHTSESVPAYPLEAILVDSEGKQAMIKSEYNIDLPIGSSFMVSQFTDKEYYKQIVDNDEAAYSIEGFLGLALSEHNKINKNETDMNEQIFTDESGLKYKFSEGQMIKLADEPIKEEDKPMADEAPQETAPVADDKKEEMADETQAPVAEQAPVDNVTYTKEEIDGKFDELMQEIGRLKAALMDVNKQEVADNGMEEVAYNAHQNFSAMLRNLPK